MGFGFDYKKYEKETKEKAQWFIARLVKGGIPRSAIATNDFSSNPVPRVYITIPYGRPRGGQQKAYQRWNTTTIKQALRWFKRKK